MTLNPEVRNFQILHNVYFQPINKLGIASTFRDFIVTISVD